MSIITNNLAEILADPKGALCFYCLSKPKITAKTKTCDISTVICPRCSMDCVFPASSIYSFEVMKGEHVSRFNKTLEDLEPCSVICTVCNMTASNIPKCFVPKPKQIMDFHDKINLQDPSKYTGKSCILEFDRYKDYESDPFYFTTNASRQYENIYDFEPYNRRIDSSPMTSTSEVACEGESDDARRAEEAYHHCRGYNSYDSTSDSSIEDTRRSRKTYPHPRRYKDYDSATDTSLSLIHI